MKKLQEPIKDRLLRRTTKQADGCWKFNGAPTRWGYRQIKVEGRLVYAHRLSFELHKGAVPDGLSVLHNCYVYDCVNPDHLFLGTQKDKMAGMIKNKRHRFSNTTHCQKGHLYTEENTRINEHGHRICRICIRAWQKAKNPNTRITKLKDEDVIRIRILYYTLQQKQIAKIYGVNPATIWGIVHGHSWTHLPVLEYTGRFRPIRSDAKIS